MAMMLLSQSNEGAIAQPLAEREVFPSGSQIEARRRDDWYRAYTSGVICPDGRVRRQSIAMIAALYGVKKTTVFDGIERARKTREAMADVLKIEGSHHAR